MTDSQIQIGNLDHENIKQSIIDFMNTQQTGSAAVLKDYNFEGSALNTLIDLLAYNTLYYAFYSNMIANEIFLDTAQKVESLISLVKPLGYVVPGFGSASAQIKIDKGGAFNHIPKYSSFIGQNNDGLSYVFYTLEDYDLDDQGDANIRVYEGKNLVVSESIFEDISNQKLFLSGLDIDISTITIEVQQEGGEFEEWSLSSNIDFDINESSKVYWLERSELGFYVVFGGRVASGESQQSGQRVTGNDVVKVTYLVSSGSAANNVGAFKYNDLYQANYDISSNHNILTLSFSSDGVDEPDLESIRFFAPKWFAAQDRAVTKDDCKSVLGSLGFPPEQSVVWGGEEMNPPMYGRLFVSLIQDDGIPAPTEDAKKAIRALEEKTCITILPEYVPAENYDVVTEINLRYTAGSSNKSEAQLRNQALSYIMDNFNDVKFDNTFDVNEMLNGISSLDSAYSTLSSTVNVRLLKEIQPSDSPIRIGFNNAINSNLGVGEAVISGKIKQSTLGENVYLEDNQGDIRAFVYINGLKTVVNANVGSVDYENGIISLRPIAQTSFNIVVHLNNPNQVVAKHNMVMGINPKVQLTAV